MSSYAYGEPVTLTLKDSAGATANLADYAEVVLTIVLPDGTSTVLKKSTSTLTANPYVFTPAQTGRHVYYYVTTTPNGSTDPQPFDVEAAGDAAIVSLTDIKADLNITTTTDDDELRSVAHKATAILVNHPAYTVADHVKRTTYTEWHDGGRPVLILRHVNVDPTTVTATEYSSTTSQAIAYEPADGGSFTAYGWQAADGSGANGILLRTSSGSPACWSGRVKVAYTAGVTTVPADLRLAALLLVEHLWETQRGSSSGGLPSGTEIESAADFTFGPPELLPPRVRQALEPYRKAPAVA